MLSEEKTNWRQCIESRTWTGQGVDLASAVGGSRSQMMPAGTSLSNSWPFFILLTNFKIGNCPSGGPRQIRLLSSHVQFQQKRAYPSPSCLSQDLLWFTDTHPRTNHWGRGAAVLWLAEPDSLAHPQGKARTSPKPCGTEGWESPQGKSGAVTKRRRRSMEQTHKTCPLSSPLINIRGTWDPVRWWDLECCLADQQLQTPT